MSSIKNFKRINPTIPIPYSERLSASTPTLNQIRLSTTNLMENNEKDLIISTQRTKIYQLEQREKELEDLNNRYKELQKEINELNEYKISLEYEIKRKDNTYNTDISLLKNEKDCLQSKYNESIANNKKLKAENDYLEKENEIKKKEIDRLNKKLNDINNQLKEISENNNILVKENKELNDLTLHSNDEMSKLIEDNYRLSQLFQELNLKIKNFERDKEHMTQVINEKNLNIDNLNNKINLQEENIKYLTKEIEENSLMNDNIEKNYKEINIKIEEMERDNAMMKDNLNKETNKRIEEENINKELNNILINKEKNMDELNKNYEDILIKQRKLNDENSEIKIELEKYKNNCKILREQNNNLMNEIQNIVSFHEKVQDKLTRKEKIKELLEDNNNILQQSLIDLDNILSKNIEKTFL